MKRVLFALFGTVAGLVALLDFKSQATPLAGGALPQASLPGAGTSSTAPSSGSSAGGTVHRARSITHPHRAGGTGPSTAAPSTTHAVPAPAARSVQGQAVQTPYGVVQVKVNLKGSTITNVSFVQLTAFDGTSQQINAYAAPRLLQQTLQAQSSQIDGVSGATYTSDGYRQSLQSALDAAGVK